MIDKNKKYRTRDGREVRIYATDGGEKKNGVHGAIKWDWGGDMLSGIRTVDTYLILVTRVILSKCAPASSARCG